MSVENTGHFPGAVVAIEWPALSLNCFASTGNAKDVAAVTDRLTENFCDAAGGNIRLIWHSLGGQIVGRVPTKLSSGYEIETVVALGAAADGSLGDATLGTEGAGPAGYADVNMTYRWQPS